MRQFLLCFIAVIYSVACASQTTVKGRVVDENNLPLEGISVKEKNSPNGTTTDAEGNYTITLKNANNALIFSGVSVTEMEMPAGSSGILDVSMKTALKDMTTIAIVGTRNIKRSSTETAVPVDIIPVARILNTLGQVDVNQILQYVAPSFNSNRQSGADGADHIDPATLRGLGPDQTLVLVNGKRFHQSSLVNLYGSRGRGNTGTDLNAIPAAAIERIEILRDGAAAQYGSDAIAGVINIILKSNTNQLIAGASAGTHITGYGGSLKSPLGKIIPSTTDGTQLNANLNYGFKLNNGGTINLTGDVLNKQKTQRPNFTALYPDNYRAKFGDGSYTNYGVYFNTSLPLRSGTNFYAFGGINQRSGDAYAWTRDAESDRNVKAIYPNGFDPHIQSSISDKSVSFGVKTSIAGWASDFYSTLGSNRFHYEVDKTLNASLEAASPTHFDAGGFQLQQNLIGMSFSKPIAGVGHEFNLAFGAELRYEQYKIFAGELASYKQFGPVVFDITGTDTTFRPGGSQGFPGFQPADEVNEGRTNIGAYIDAEIDVTKNFMLGGAARFESYSDFGLTHNYKLSGRLKVSNDFAVRGSISTGFRAPSLPQIYFSSTFTNVVAGQIVDQVIAPNSGELARAVGIPELEEEKSVNTSFGFTLKPARNLNFTMDGYRVSIKDRIVLTGLFDSGDPEIGATLQAKNVGAAQFFTNAVDTKTTGLDIIGTYLVKLGAGQLTTTAAANFNDMNIESIRTSSALSGKEDIYFGPREKSFLLASAPKHKISLSFDYKINKFSTNLRLTDFSKVELTNWNNETDIYKNKITADLSFSYMFSKSFTATIGGSNILDTYPTAHDPGLTETGGMWDAVQMGFGGAFVFAKLGLKLVR